MLWWGKKKFRKILGALEGNVSLFKRVIWLFREGQILEKRLMVAVVRVGIVEMGTMMHSSGDKRCARTRDLMQILRIFYFNLKRGQG